MQYNPQNTNKRPDAQNAIRQKRRLLCRIMVQKAKYPAAVVVLNIKTSLYYKSIKQARVASDR
jgi:hypothetical protein